MKILLFLIGSLAWAQGNVPAIGYTVGGAGSVASPTDSPGTGTYTTSQAVTLSDSTSGSTICYTTNGTSPAATTPGTCSTGSTYSSPFTLSATATVKALGTKAALTNSSVATLGVYTIQNAAPTDTNSGGSCTGSSPTWTCTGTTTVTLASTTGGSTICYTVDGSTPAAATPGTCSAGTTYSGTISVSATTTIKALATKTGLTNSGVLTSAYTVSGGGGTITLSSHSSLGSSNGTSVTTAGINTTGDNLLIVAASWYSLGGTITVSDSVGGTSNSWTQLSSYFNPASSLSVSIFYSVPTHVGSGHTFTITGSGTVYPAIATSAFATAGLTFDSPDNGSTSSGGATTLATGAITVCTPSCANKELVVSALTFNTGTVTGVDSSGSPGWAITDTVSPAGNNYGLSLGWVARTASGSIDATWTMGISSILSGGIAGFK